MSGIEVGTAFVRIMPLIDPAAFNAAIAAQIGPLTTASKAAAATQVAAQKTVAEATVAASAVKVAAERSYLAEALASSTVQKTATRGVVAAAVAAAQTQVAAAGTVTAANVVTAESIGAVAASYKVSAAAAVQAASVQRAALVGQAAAVAAGSNILGALGPAAAVTAGQATTRAVGKGLVDVGTGANAARGALIGLSRVSPVAIFGLGLVGTAAIGAGLAIKGAITSAAEFESQLLTFQAVTQATDAQMQAVSSAALALGADLSLPATSANDAAVALTELSKAGLSVEDSLAAAKGVLQLATIAGLSAGDAATIAATQLNAFGLAGDQATRVTELLADASIAAQGEITDFAAGFAQAGTAAKQSGVSIEDTTALLTQLGLAGIKGADGGTSLRTFLLRLVPTTKEASEYTKALGIQLDKTKSIGAQLPSVIEQYRTQLEKLNPQQQTLVLNQIFGQDAFRAASVIFSQQKDALRALTDEFEKTNATQDLSKAKSEGLKGAVGSLKSQMETFGTTVGLLASGPLESLVRGLSDTFEGIGDVVQAFADFRAVEDIKKVITFELKVVDKILGPTGLTLKEFLLLVNPATAPFALLSKLGGRDKDEGEKGVAPFDVSSNPAASGAGVTAGKVVARGVDEDQQAAAKAAAAAAAKLDPALQARIAAVNKANAEAAKNGVLIPRRLQQAQIDAQIANSLSAELSADNAILKYLETRLSNLNKGTQKYLAVSQQLEFAQSQRDSVQAEIDGNSERQKAEKDAARKQRVADAEAEAKKDAAAQEQLRQTIVNIQSQRFSNALAAANLTETDADNKRILSAEQRRLEAAKKAAEKIARTAGLTNQQLADAKLKVLELDGKILGVKSQIKNLGQGGASGGFSLNDLFKEALNQFEEFGSNVSSSPLTPGGVRGSFAGSLVSAIAGSKKDRKELGLDRVASSTSSMDVTLKNIERLLRGEPVSNGTSTSGSPNIGRLTKQQAAGLAARRVGGA